MIYAWVAESVDARDLKSRVLCGRAGSSPALGTILTNHNTLCVVGFPSGQREQTVNLPAQPSKVQILLQPPYTPIAQLVRAHP